MVPTLLSTTVVSLDCLIAGVGRTCKAYNSSCREMTCLRIARVGEVRVIEFKSRTSVAQNSCPKKIDGGNTNLDQICGSFDALNLATDRYSGI